MGKRRQKGGEDDKECARGNRIKECQANHLTKEMEGGMEGMLICCKVWTAQLHDSPGVIMTEWSLIDWLSLQDLQSTSVFLQCLAPLLWTSVGSYSQQHDS